MKLYLFFLCSIVPILKVYSQDINVYPEDNGIINAPIIKLADLSFYYDYEWTDKNAKNQEGSFYKTRLEKQPELNGQIFINRSFDSTKEHTPLQPFLTGVSGWDPVEKVIKFLDFSKSGMMVEGTIVLVDDYTVQYDFYFSYPGNKKKLQGRDVLNFNLDRTEFNWISYLVLNNGELKALNEQRMIRGKKISE